MVQYIMSSHKNDIACCWLYNAVKLVFISATLVSSQVKSKIYKYLLYICFWNYKVFVTIIYPRTWDRVTSHLISYQKYKNNCTCWFILIFLWFVDGMIILFLSNFCGGMLEYPFWQKPLNEQPVLEAMRPVAASTTTES